jgi:hypothetical protein
MPWFYLKAIMMCILFSEETTSHYTIDSDKYIDTTHATDKVTFI